MARIQLLPPELANKIAAGEVVERPASVVKELVENSLDAGATRVDVQLVDAGKTLIRVADDGIGMDAEDLKLAFEPHATSKLSSVEELFRVLTHGFRGEALASIQSVSRARITTRTRAASVALQLECVGGQAGEIREAAGTPGTVIEIRDLFFNVPARRRWLKGDSTEFSHVVELLQSIAAANPEVGFSLTHGERKAFDVPAGQSQDERVRALYGDRFHEGLLEVHEYESYGRLDGYIAPPAMHRPNSKGLLLFVNRRPIKDRSLIQAVILAYREFLPPGRYPVAVLFLTVDPESIDVNVHPAKTEVRFLEHNRIFSLIKSALAEKLINSGVLPGIRLHGPAMPQARPDSPFEPTFDVSRPRLFDAQSEQRARDAEHRWDEARRVLDEALGPVVSRYEVRDVGTGARSASDGVGEAADDSRQAAEKAAQTGSSLPPDASRLPPLLAQAKALFQVGATYIVVEVADGMVVIDQHAYHERILYWLLENRISSQAVERQRLLVPQPLELSLAAAALAEAHSDALREFGFELEPFGHGAWALRAVPKFSVGGKHLEVVQEILEELAQGRKPQTPTELRKSMVESVACHAAIKAGDVLEPQQIKSLLQLGETVPHTFSCPHGRPTTYKLGFADLEKIFHRR
ncbi:MAG: DNA mismatch repair endonuclease MutL [Planctomycetes bacterium]|nr:DNA mismatch repair endonuclease MutL [Planctomycetota bacterium]